MIVCTPADKEDFASEVRKSARAIAKAGIKICPRCQRPYRPRNLQRHPYCGPVCRLWDQVDIGATEDCWPFRGKLSSWGYGSLGHYSAHRVAYSAANGAIPPRKVVRHSCDNRVCCNPSHLLIGTVQDNATDRVVRNRTAKGSKNARAKLNEDQVASIKQQLAAGFPPSALAKLWNVHAVTIRCIRSGKSWDHVSAFDVGPVIHTMIAGEAS